MKWLRVGPIDEVSVSSFSLVIVASHWPEYVLIHVQSLLFP